MTSMAVLPVQERLNTGTGAARASRRAEMVPGVLYGKTQSPVSVQLEKRVLLKEMQQPGIMTRVYEFQLAGKTHRALIRDIQLHPVSDIPLHIDFMEVSKDSKIHLQVPVHFLNEEKSPGMKKGGVLNAIYHNLDIQCFANDIPDHITIDLGEGDIGFTVHFKDIKLPKGVTFVHENLNDTILTIVPPKVGGEKSSDEENAA